MQTTLDQMEKDDRTLHLAVAFALVNKPAGRIVWVKRIILKSPVI